MANIHNIQELAEIIQAMLENNNIQDIAKVIRALANNNKATKKRKREDNLRTWKWSDVIDVDDLPTLNLLMSQRLRKQQLNNMSLHLRITMLKDMTGHSDENNDLNRYAIESNNRFPNFIPALMTNGFTPNNDVRNTSPTSTLVVMLSSTVVVDNNGNAVHQTQSFGVHNPSNPTRSANHANVLNTSSLTRDVSHLINLGESDTDLHTSVEGKVKLPFLHDPPSLLIELMDYNGGEHSKLLWKKIKLYIYDIEHEVENRLYALSIASSSSVVDNHLRLLLHDLITMLDLNNPLVQYFRMARDRFRESSIQPVTLCLIGTRQHNARQYNLPTTSKVAALISGDGNPTNSRDVIVEEYGNEHRRKTLHKAGRLFHTYCVDAYTAVLDHDLDWYKLNQNIIRADLYDEFNDHVVNGDTNAEFLGRKCILPSTFTGGPRHMIQQYQDAMAICHWAGPPDLLILSTDEIDHVISAELSFEVDNLIGFEAVRTHMMHGPCGDLYRSSAGIHVDHKLQFVEEPIEITEREIKRLKQSRIPLVKVRWKSRRGPKFTWEREDSFKQKYLQLYTNRASSSTTSNTLGYSIFRCNSYFGGVTDWYQSQGYREPAVMSSVSSTVTYTSVYTDSELGRVFWGADEELSDDGSPRVIVYGYDGLPMQPIAQSSPDYIPGPEEPQTPPHVNPAEEQPLPPVVSPTAESPGYVTESDPEEDPEEYGDDETEDGPVDYPMDRGEDGDDDDGDSSGDDADDEDEEDEEEVEEHLALADSAVVVPNVELISPPKGTDPVTPPPSTDITTTGARITVRLQASISFSPEVEVERLLAMPTPPPSPPISLSPPSAGESLTRCTTPSEHSSPPPVPSLLLPSSGCPTQIQTLRIASTQALVDAVTAALPSPPLLPLPPSLYVPPPVDHRDDIPEPELPPRKRSCLSTLGSRYEVGESSTARPTGGQGINYGVVSTIDAEVRRWGIREVGYGIRDTWVDPAEAVPEITPMTIREVNTRVTELAELHEHDTQDLYALLEDAHDSRTHISHRVTMDSQRVDLHIKDRIAHQETVLIIEEEAYASREAWAHSVGLSQAVHYELQTYHEPVYAHESQIQAHQTQLQLQDMRREMGDMQAELLALREQQRRARQPGPDVRVPDHQDASRDADSHI
ncbi:reverse transcriptase domain-containing protein [Tanacetum coccineum]